MGAVPPWQIPQPPLGQTHGQPVGRTEGSVGMEPMLQRRNSSYGFNKQGQAQAAPRVLQPKPANRKAGQSKTESDMVGDFCI